VRPSLAERIDGCLVAGAVGDALGAPIEFMSRAEILGRVGPAGVREYLDGDGHITDDTQMTLFTAEGLIRTRVRREQKGIADEASMIDHAYTRWLRTQGLVSERWGEEADDGWLVNEPAMNVRRAPGNTCITAMSGAQAGSIERPINESKGCGGVMRVAPVGLIPGLTADLRFRLGAESAALTHGHPSGFLSAGFLAAMIGALGEGADPLAAAQIAREELVEWDENFETRRFVDSAIERAEDLGPPTPELLDGFGEGWVAEEALGISLWAALSAKSITSGLTAAVTHSGDSDSTGAITGNLLGATFGISAVPRGLIDGLCEREIVQSIATDLFLALASEEMSAEIIERYPGV